MKLTSKTALIIGLTSIFLLGFTYFDTARSTFVLYAILIIVMGLATFALIHVFVLKHIEKLIKQINAIQTEKTGDHHSQSKKDELSIASEKINLLFNQITKLRNESNKADLTVNSNNETTRVKEGISRLAHYDTLTALPNRIFFNETLNKSINHAKRHKKILAIMTLNLDTFKFTNDLGKNIGDQVLKEIAKRLSTTLRSDDLLARSDGDEFIILLNDIGKPKFASTVAEKLLKACAQTISIEAHDINITASIGICIFPNDGDSLEDLLKNADIAQHKAKNIGGNGYQFYTNEMNTEAHEYIKLESALRNALTNNELSLYYQPKLHIKNGNIAGVEALIRWTHPEYGMISPAIFIPIAEETGLISAIGEWALREACKTNKSWQDEGYEHLSVAINLSSKQFYNPNIAQIITDILNETKLSPNYLELELTETTVMNDIDASMNILNKIKETGVQISIDHFGTGYTSISHLKKFAINSVKIDQNFIKGVPNNPNDSAITTALIVLAHSLGIQVVAEGVETAEQVQFLSTQNCDMVQGYFLSHPLPAQKIVLQFKKLFDEILF